MVMSTLSPKVLNNSSSAPISSPINLSRNASGCSMRPLSPPLARSLTHGMPHAVHVALSGFHQSFDRNSRSIVGVMMAMASGHPHSGGIERVSVVWPIETPHRGQKILRRLEEESYRLTDSFSSCSWSSRSATAEAQCLSPSSGRPDSASALVTMDSSTWAFSKAIPNAASCPVAPRQLLQWHTVDMGSRTSSALFMPGRRPGADARSWKAGTDTR